MQRFKIRAMRPLREEVAYVPTRRPLSEKTKTNVCSECTDGESRYLHRPGLQREGLLPLFSASATSTTVHAAAGDFAISITDDDIVPSVVI
jgi:hypothetical protein